jgi:opacity protein-like surface antigen
MKKKTGVLGLAVLLAALLALTGVAQSAMWVGGQIGGNFVSSSSMDVDVLGVTGTVNDVDFHNSVIGGAAIGYDFINAGFGAYAWPDWMKYFSVFTDFTYNRRDIRSAALPAAWGVPTAPAFAFANVPVNQRIEGYDACWSFMLMAHYPFLPDSEVPSGRVNPYVAVGPGILFSNMNVGNGWGSASSVNIALVVEGGVRFMCLKNVSLDAAFRYRYAEPSYDLDVAGVDVSVSPELNMFSFLFRANYHF